MLTNKLTVACLAIFVSAAASSQEVYRWVDEQGRTHVSDAVPDQYKRTARVIDTSRSKITDAQRAAGAARAEKERARSDEYTAARERREKAFAQAAGNAAAQSKPPAGKAARQGATECEQLWQTYRESQECFAPYGRQEHGVRLEAFQHCKQVDNPSQQCGPSNW